MFTADEIAFIREGIESLLQKLSMDGEATEKDTSSYGDVMAKLDMMESGE